jgi:Rrf2 family protein
MRMLADIAKHCQGDPVVLKDVAARQDLPKLYLSQLTGSLKSASLLKSTWGNKGGYVLGRPPSDIRLLDVFEAVEGPVAVLDCVVDPAYCDRAAYCTCRAIWKDINQAIVAILEKYTVADLINKSPSPSGVREQDLVQWEEAVHGNRCEYFAGGRKRGKRKDHSAGKG